MSALKEEAELRAYSDVYEAEPVGFEGQPRFLNMAAQLESKWLARMLERDDFEKRYCAGAPGQAALRQDTVRRMICPRCEGALSCIDTAVTGREQIDVPARKLRPAARSG